MVWEQWTEQALQTIAHARNEAQRLGDSQVCTEHLLLGILAEPDPQVKRLLEHFNIPLEKLRHDIDRNIQPAIPFAQTAASAGKPELPLAMRSIHVTDLAENEAYLSGSTLVHPAHVLLALIRDGEGLAGRILLNLGASQTEEARQLVSHGISA
ncbi:MAG: Clp protease N-terminal domain-containing protein [Armatimonadota bacterium]